MCSYGTRESSTVVHMHCIVPFHPVTSAPDSGAPPVVTQFSTAPIGPGSPRMSTVAVALFTGAPLDPRVRLYRGLKP